MFAEKFLKEYVTPNLKKFVIWSMFQIVLKILWKNARKSAKTFTGVRFALIHKKNIKSLGTNTKISNFEHSEH